MILLYAFIIGIVCIAIAGKPWNVLKRWSVPDDKAPYMHAGNCGYGYLAEDAGTGWDIAALSDVISAPSFDGSCGLVSTYTFPPATAT